MQAVLSGQAPSFSLEKRYLRKDGSTQWGHLTASILEAGPDDMTFLAETGDFSTVVDTVYPLADAARAHDHSRTFRTRGKLILEVR